LQNVTALALGTSHACALAGGSVRCWGWNFYGQLGNGTTNDSATPDEVFSSGVIDIGAGAYHTLALRHTGTTSWGSNSSGQLGNGTTVDSSIPVAVM
jgi:alpha-tubulin suppressor-like RCC1 family protein